MILNCFIIIILPYPTEISSQSFFDGKVVGKPIKMQVRVIKMLTYMYIL